MEKIQMFDYTKFEEDLVLQMKNTLQEWSAENEDIYIFTLDCSRGADSVGVIANTENYLSEQADSDDDDYWYYKYCEEEWELFEGFEEISAYMCAYAEENDEVFTDSETCEYTEAFEEHYAKVSESCQNVLARFRQSIEAEFPGLMLAFNVREYLDGEERVEIFSKLNDARAAEEYKEHIDEFA